MTPLLPGACLRGITEQGGHQPRAPWRPCRMGPKLWSWLLRDAARQTALPDTCFHPWMGGGGRAAWGTVLAIGFLFSLPNFWVLYFKPI
ncbi:unnamed protein product [Nyctereutes procyonoides]|uniref:(raccoon dog) hypothetical protein n=1 Tax=Nyctereutes procyonoides TaxID=34880 RepID=A0A811Y323_NYCPR|nr:unnamed protein product [Nyctereutes procyonoides]